jgi:hypothetical protein
MIPRPVPSREALVVFVDRASAPWSRLLGRGFRHCFVALRRHDGWLICDPLKHRLELAFLRRTADLDLAAWYVAQGHRVLRGPVQRTAVLRRHRTRPRTCVAAVKRLLRLEQPAVLTPRQLFDHLQRHPTPGFGRVAGEG